MMKKFFIISLLFFNNSFTHITIDENSLSIKNLGIKYSEIKTILDFLKKMEPQVSHWLNYYRGVIPKLIKKFNLKIGVEVGVAFATHSEHILQETDATLFCIDPYEHFSEEEWPGGFLNWKQKYHDVWFIEVKNRLKKYDGRAAIIRKTSIEAAKDFQDDSMDFVFIDGNHSYKSIKADIKTWYKKIKSGGLLSGDDYTPGVNRANGVKTAVDEFCKKENLELNQDGEHGRIWWFIKP